MGWELQTSFVLGALHSLEPGHGKTAMLAMMLDPKKRWWDSVTLAVSMVVSHSLLILAVAVLTHFGGHILFGGKLDEFLLENLRVFGSLSLVLIGLFLLLRSDQKPSHCCGHESSHSKSHSPKLPILIGVTIGLYPCPSLIATFLASLSTGHFSLGITAVCLFSLGSFASILLTTLFLKWVGGKVTNDLELRFSKINWKKVQGAIILFVGTASFFTH